MNVLRPWLWSAWNLTAVCLRGLAIAAFCVLAFAAGFALAAIGVEVGSGRNVR